MLFTVLLQGILSAIMGPASEGVLKWFTTLRPPAVDAGLTSSHLDRIIKPYAKALSDRGSYFVFLCPRKYPHGSHAVEGQEANPSCVAYKTACFATDFHLDSADPDFNIPPFPLWCYLKYGSFNAASDRSRYPEFCDELGLSRSDLRPTFHLIVEWALEKFKFSFKDKWQLYSDARKEYMSAAVFNQSFDDGILDTLRQSAKECNPPLARRRYLTDQMPAFFKAWAPPAFHQIWDSLPNKERINAIQLPIHERELFIFNLRGLLTKQILFSFKGASKPFATSLIALASDLDLSKSWQAIEDYPVFFMQTEQDQQTDLRIGMTYDLVCQLNSEWAKSFRSSGAFTRQFIELGIGKAEVIWSSGRTRRVLTLLASKIDLELRGPSTVVEGALEEIGSNIEEERYSK